MQNKFPVLDKINEITDRLRTVDVVQRASKQRLVSGITSLNPTDTTQTLLSQALNLHSNTSLQRNASDLLPKKEYDRLIQICELIQLSSAVQFSSASKDSEITQEVIQCMLGLLEGKESLAAIKAQLNSLRIKDQKNIQLLSISTVFSGIFTSAGIIALVLMLTLLPATWPLVAMFVASPTLICLMLTLYLVYNDIQYRKTCINRAWNDLTDAVKGINHIIDELTENDIALLKKMHSPEWSQQLEDLKATLKPKNTGPAVSQSPLSGHDVSHPKNISRDISSNRVALKTMHQNNTQEQREQKIRELEELRELNIADISLF